MATLGIDIGGANLKFADSSQLAHSITFPMWQRSSELATQLRKTANLFLHVDQIAVTMTGEMADCFDNRRIGAQCILHAVDEAFPELPISVYSVEGQWLSIIEAFDDPWRVAASNWRAISEYVAKHSQTPSLLIDLGSTTTDLIRIEASKVCTESRTDLDRLLAGELVYTGIERSNLVGLAHSVTIDSKTYPIINEQFATTADVYRVLGFIPCDDRLTETSDGKPQSMHCSLQRLVRTIGTDLECISHRFALELANCFFESQSKMLSDAIRVLLQRFNRECRDIVVSGHGDFLVRKSLEKIGWQGTIHSLQQQLGPSISRAACAYAVAWLFDQKP